MDFFRARAGWGCTAPDPVFIVGLPRAGSTLVEQILASHPAIEGTMELPDILVLARKLGGRTKDAVMTYLQALPAFSEDASRSLGADYLERTRVQRKSEKSFFIDKMPNNFHHIGLIHLILPNAKIIDARPPSAGLLSVQLQAALRTWPSFRLRSCRDRRLLSRLRGN